MHFYNEDGRNRSRTYGSGGTLNAGCCRTCSRRGCLTSSRYRSRSRAKPNDHINKLGQWRRAGKENYNVRGWNSGGQPYHDHLECWRSVLPDHNDYDKSITSRSLKGQFVRFRFERPSIGLQEADIWSQNTLRPRRAGAQTRLRNLFRGVGTKPKFGLDQA
jgi:hypothetical protein